MEMPIPVNESERLVALREYRILDTPAEEIYDEICELAAQICGCPLAVIGMIDQSREWLKSKYGLPKEMTAVPRHVTMCSATICQNDLLLVPDLTQDERFRDSPLVTGPPNLRFYCGMPLINPDGYALGTLCIMDVQPRQITFEQGEQVRRLSRQVAAQLELRRKLFELDGALGELRQSREELAAQRTRSDDLLLNILPAAIANELKRNGRVAPHYHGAVTILFADFEGFTRLAASMEPAALVHLLDRYFSKFDEIVAAHGLEKLKTIGDAYMCVGGLPETNRTHPHDACLAALAMQAFVAEVKRERDTGGLPGLEMRVGIHTGPVMAGVVGKRKFTYDIWGDAVNVAALMEANGMPGRVNISEGTYQRVKDLFATERRGSVQAKNKGQLDMYFLDRIKPEFSRDADGLVPNDQFTTRRSGVVADFSQWTGGAGTTG